MTDAKEQLKAETKQAPSTLEHELVVLHNHVPRLKKSQSLLEPVYKFVGFNSAPTDKQIKTLMLLGIMVILFIFSVTGFFVMWFTEFYDNSIASRLILANNSLAAEWWVNPPMNPHLKVHVFNYTNIDRYLSGEDDKIKVEDLGPYTYEQRSTKVNVEFNANYTVTFNDHRSYKFRPELSSGQLDDRIVAPNLPFLTAAHRVDKMGFIAKFMATQTLQWLNLKPFIAKEVDEYFWGYNDILLDTLRTLPGNSDVPEKFGVLMKRNGTSPDVIQIYTGEDDMRKIGLVSMINGQTKLDLWGTEECNRIDGSDGAQWPPHLMDKRQQLEVYTQALCRKLPLEYSEEVTLFDGVVAWRYRTPRNVFDSPDLNPDNQCFCTTDVCLPSGVMNGSACYGAPIYPSFPHFFTGDPSLYAEFEGIEPVAEKHQTFADIHPKLGFPIDGSSKIQINIQVHKGTLLRGKLQKIDDGFLLPVLWIEVTLGELNDELRTLIFHSTFSANAVRIVLKYGTLLTCVTSFALIVAAFYYLGKMHTEQLKEIELEKERGELENLNKFRTIELDCVEVDLGN